MFNKAFSKNNIWLQLMFDKTVVHPYTLICLFFFTILNSKSNFPLSSVLL